MTFILVIMPEADWQLNFCQRSHLKPNERVSIISLHFLFVYSCEAKNKKGVAKRFQRIIKVEAPSIYQTNLLGESADVAAKTAGEGDAALKDPQHKAKIIAVGVSMTLKCRVTGRPPPTVTWLLNDIEVDASAGRVNLTDGNQTLVVGRMEPADAGRYECVVANQGGRTSLYQMVRVEETNLLATIYASGIVVPVAIAVGIALVLAAGLLLLGRMCWNKGRWKAPPTPPTPRLTQVLLVDLFT
jgi:hypothetical protein